jgi:hypothetical protein
VTKILPLTIEAMVAVLLLLTILYCVRLNGQLRRLKGDEATMQATIAELVAAVETAERAIAGLKTTVREAEATLGEQLRAAEAFSGEMLRNTEAGAQVLDRLTQIAGAKPWLMGVQAAGGPAAAPPKPAAPDPNQIAAAAHAFTERAKSRVKGLAA